MASPFEALASAFFNDQKSFWPDLLELVQLGPLTSMPDALYIFNYFLNHHLLSLEAS